MWHRSSGSQKCLGTDALRPKTLILHSENVETRNIACSGTCVRQTTGAIFFVVHQIDKFLMVFVHRFVFVSVSACVCVSLSGCVSVFVFVLVLERTSSR